MANYLHLSSVGRLATLLAMLYLPIMGYAAQCDTYDEPDNDGDECYSTPQPADVAAALGSSNGNGDTNCPACQAGQYVNDPINEATGNVYETETDYTGYGPFPLQLQRYYNSQYTASGSFGANWSHRWDAKLLITATTITTIRNNQKSLVFTLTGGVWQAGANVNAKLTAVTGGWQYLNGQDGIENYDSNGRLLSITNRAGLTQTLSYSGTGNLASVSDPFGRTITFSYDSNNRIISATDPSGATYAYTYDGNNNLTSVVYPDKTTRQYNYASTTFPHALTSLVNENKLAISSWTYAAGSITPNGVAISGVEAGGVGGVSLQYDFVNGTTQETDALGTVRTYAYENINGAVLTLSGTQPASSGNGTVTDYWFYDNNGNISQIQDFIGNNTYYTYDTTRNLETSRKFPDGTIINTTWNPNFRLPASISEPNRTTAFTYDSHGNLTQKTITDANNSNNTRTWGYSYNSAGQVTSADGPRTDVSDITTFTYDSHGNLSTRTDALGHVTRYTSFDASGRPLSWVDPNGLQTTLTYDQRGRLLTSTVGAETTRYAYDATGNLLKTTFPDGSYLQYSYDSANRLIGLTDALGNSVVYTLDAMGNRVKEQTNDPNQTLTRTLSRSYDSLNRLAQTIGAQNQTTAYGYDDNDNPTSVTDPLTNINQTYYDSRNRPTALSAPNYTYTYYTYYAYDGNSQLTAVTDPKYNQTSYVYDGLGNKTQQTSPDTGVTTYTYDAAGNVITSTDARGVQTLYAYDALNRLIKKSFTPNSSYGDISSATYQYDQGTYGISHLTGMTDTSGATTWLYEIHGRVVQQQQTIGLVTLTTHYQYDAASRLSQLTTPANNTMAYQYNANGQVNAVTVGGTVLFNSAQYQPFGPISSWVWGNGTAYKRSYDLDGRLTNLPLGTDNRSYTYDADSRITAAASDGSVQSVSPSFITPANAGSTYYTINYSNNSLTQISASGTTLNMGYDAAGNLLNDSVNNYQYDLGGRLMSVGSASFQMDGHGKRVSKTSLTSGPRYFAYDQAGHLLGEYNTQGLAIQETIWLGNTPVGTVSASTGLLYVYADHLNTPRTVTTQSNRVIWSWVSDPFGNGVPITSNDDSGNPYQFNLRFPGQYYDQETGLHYNMARYYNPAIGRYTQSDPIGLGGGGNTYAYAKGNSINHADIAGLISNPAELTCIDPAQPVCWGGVIADVGSDLWALYRAYSAAQEINAVLNANNSADEGSQNSDQTNTPNPPIPDKPDQCPGEGWEWRGKLPVGGDKGAWHNPETGESLHPDIDHPAPIGPHWDYTDPQGKGWRIFPDGQAELK